MMNAPAIAKHLTPVTTDSATTDAASEAPALKIALLGYRSAPFVGGQGIYLRYLSAALHQLGHTVHVYSGPPYPDLVAGVELIKVPSLDLYASENHVRALRWQHLSSFTDTWEWFGMLTGGFPEPYTFGRRIAKRLRNSDYDVIHDNQSLCYGLLALQKNGLPVVSTIHHPIHRDLAVALEAAPNWQYRLLTKRWYSFLRMQEKVTAQLKHVITVSKQSQKDIKQFFKCDKKHIPIISNGVDHRLFKPRPEIQRKPCQLITTASADQPLKGLQFLLQTLADLSTSVPDISLIVIGKLKANGDTEKQIKHLGLNGRIRFYSEISTDKIVELYAESTIAISPSLYEGFGLPLAEAMACGIPVISSDGGALPEVVGDAGIVVPAGNSPALSKAIQSLLNCTIKQKQLGEKALLRARQHFCWEKVARDLSDYYRNIMSKNAHH